MSKEEPNKKNVKLPKTYAEQIEILKNKGLIINDTDLKDTEFILSNTNYYRLSGYLFQFKNKEQNSYFFPEGFTFKNAYNIYNFDIKLSNILYSIIQKVEISLKTKMAYIFSIKYDSEGIVGYLDENNFQSVTTHIEFKNLLAESINRNKEKIFVKHHLDNYEEFPLWVAVELFTFGMLANFYRMMKTEDKKALSKEFDILPKHLDSWLPNINKIRNIIAHNMRLYNFKFRDPLYLKTKKENKTYEKSNMIFDTIYVLKLLYFDKHEWNNEILPTITELILKNSDFIDLKKIGFPEENWLNLLTK